MTDVSPHAWYREKLTLLMAEAEQAGIARDVSVAVITDLVNGELSRARPIKADEGWNQDIGEPDNLVNGPATSPGDIPGGPMADEVPFNPLSHVGGRRHTRR